MPTARSWTHFTNTATGLTNGAIEKAKTELNGQFNQDNYPKSEVMAGKFYFTWSWMEFNVPKDLPEDVKKREQAKLEKQFKDASVEVLFGLREAFGGFVEDLRRRLEVVPGTKGTRFTAAGAVDNMRDFIERFGALNFANDLQLAALVENAKSIVKDVDGSKLKSNEALRNKFKSSFKAIGEVLAPLIEERPARRMMLED